LGKTSRQSTTRQMKIAKTESSSERSINVPEINASSGNTLGEENCLSLQKRVFHGHRKKEQPEKNSTFDAEQVIFPYINSRR
jgi:hypothetical protein